jgi:hypothetical protein
MHEILNFVHNIDRVYTDNKANTNKHFTYLHNSGLSAIFDIVVKLYRSIY